MMSKGVFQCLCGAKSFADGGICCKCKRSIEEIYSKYDLDYIASNAEIRLQKEQEEREEAERERIRIAEEKRKHDEQVLEEARLKAAAKKKKVKRIVSIVIVSIVFLALLYGTIFHLIPLIRYNVAASNVSKLEFDKAYNTYVSLKNYKDSSDKAIETLYAKASYLEENKLFAEAIVEYEKIPDYKNSLSQVEFCKKNIIYYDGIDYFEAGQYEEALNKFGELNNFLDSTYYSNKCDYFIAEALFNEKEYEKAYDKYAKLGDFEDSKDKANEAKFMQSETLYAQKKYYEAYINYGSLGTYKNSNEKAIDSYYQHALGCKEKGDYKTASDFFGSSKLSSYGDAKDLYKETTYLYAKERYESEDYPEAIDYFAKITGYEDSDKLLQDARYKLGCEYLDNKNYNEAVKQFELLGNYKDSKKKANEAKYGYVKNHKFDTDTTTYNYLKELKKSNYSDSNKIYKELYDWKAELLYINTSENGTSDYSSLNYYDKWYFHFVIKGGPPSGSTKVKYKMVFPNGSVRSDTFDGVWSNGDELYVYGYWSIYGDYYSMTGTCSVYLYDENGNQIGKGSVKIV